MIQISPKRSITYGQSIINVYHASKGEGLPMHEHNISHLSICHAGKCVIRKEGKEKIFDKDSDPVDLVANEWHEIEALEDNTIFVNIFRA
jgi:quercetin dioxygenase-like cupin family protein